MLLVLVYLVIASGNGVLAASAAAHRTVRGKSRRRRRWLDRGLPTGALELRPERVRVSWFVCVLHRCGGVVRQQDAQASSSTGQNGGRSRIREGARTPSPATVAAAAAAADKAAADELRKIQ